MTRVGLPSFIIQQEVTFPGQKQRHFIFPTKPEETVCWPLNYRDNDSLALGIMGPVLLLKHFPALQTQIIIIRSALARVSTTKLYRVSW